MTWTAVAQYNEPGIAGSIEECHEAFEKIRREADILLPLYDPAVFDRHPGGIIA